MIEYIILFLVAVIIFGAGYGVATIGFITERIKYISKAAYWESRTRTMIKLNSIGKGHD